jgi:hypothetical protein
MDRVVEVVGRVGWSIIAVGVCLPEEAEPAAEVVPQPLRSVLQLKVRSRKRIADLFSFMSLSISKK